MDEFKTSLTWKHVEYQNDVQTISRWRISDALNWIFNKFSYLYDIFIGDLINIFSGDKESEETMLPLGI